LLHITTDYGSLFYNGDKMEKEPKQTTDGADVDQPGPNRNPWAPLPRVSEEASREEHFRKAREAAIE
jgi:hypothetical protein